MVKKKKIYITYLPNGPTSNETTIEYLIESDTQVGRNHPKEFKITDKRCSRCQAVLSPHNETFSITPKGLNPCTLLRSGNDTPEELQKDQTYEIKDGDIFSLLPNEHYFRCSFKSDVEASYQPQSSRQQQQQHQHHQPKRKRNDDYDDVGGSGDDDANDEANNARNRSTTLTHKKRKMEENEQNVTNDDSRPHCEYGAKCYRKNADHNKKYYHPHKDEFGNPRKQTSSSNNDRTSNSKSSSSSNNRSSSHRITENIDTKNKSTNNNNNESSKREDEREIGIEVKKKQKPFSSSSSSSPSSSSSSTTNSGNQKSTPPTSTSTMTIRNTQNYKNNNNNDHHPQNNKKSSKRNINNNDNNNDDDDDDNNKNKTNHKMLTSDNRIKLETVVVRPAIPPTPGFTKITSGEDDVKRMPRTPQLTIAIRNELPRVIPPSRSPPHQNSSSSSSSTSSNTNSNARIKTFDPSSLGSYLGNLDARNVMTISALCVDDNHYSDFNDDTAISVFVNAICDFATKVETENYKINFVNTINSGDQIQSMVIESKNNRVRNLNAAYHISPAFYSGGFHSRCIVCPVNWRFKPIAYGRNVFSLFKSNSLSTLIKKRYTVAQVGEVYPIELPNEGDFERVRREHSLQIIFLVNPPTLNPAKPDFTRDSKQAEGTLMKCYDTIFDYFLKLLK